MSKGRSKGGGKRAMQQVTRRSPWRPRVFPSHAARDKACEHQASWLRTRDERHGERRGFVNHGALICAERHRERRGFVNHGALICDRCGSWRMAEASNVFELLHCEKGQPHVSAAGGEGQRATRRGPSAPVRPVHVTVCRGSRLLAVMNSSPFAT